jgi:hypothetical protein
MFSDVYYKAALSFLKAQLPEYAYKITYQFLEKQHSRFAREDGEEGVATEEEEVSLTREEPLDFFVLGFPDLHANLVFFSYRLPIQGANPLSVAAQWFVTIMIAFFFLSILQTVAQSGLRAKQSKEIERLQEKKQKKEKSGKSE